MWAAPCPLMEGVRLSSEPLWEGSREGAASDEWQVHLFILSFSYCKCLSAPWQVRDLPHTETFFSHVSLPTLAVYGCGGMGVVPWFVSHPTGQCTDFPMALLVLTVYGGWRMPATGATCAEKWSHGGSKHCVLVFDQKS